MIERLRRHANLRDRLSPTTTLVVAAATIDRLYQIESAGMKNLWSIMAQSYRAWKIRCELSQFTDRELGDIGISRSDIDWIAEASEK